MNNFDNSEKLMETPLEQLIAEFRDDANWWRNMNIQDDGLSPSQRADTIADILQSINNEVDIILLNHLNSLASKIIRQGPLE